jgi:hypothetical protein
MLEKVRAASLLGTRPPISSTVGVRKAQPSRSSRSYLMLADLKMQITNAPSAQQFRAIVVALKTERISRYMPSAGKDQERAFKYYLWNCLLCESFHLPLHFAEVLCRNALHEGLRKRFGDNWFGDRLFLSILDERFRNELTDVISVEAQDHGQAMTCHHVCSGLTFGFWEHLVTKRFDRILWAKGIRNVFPCAPKQATRQELHALIESVRRWRNRIAHHRAIFDRGPMRKYQDTLELIKWVCTDTGVWVASVSRVPEAITLRP